MNKKRLCALTALTLAVAMTLGGCGEKEETPEVSAPQTAASEEAAARELSLTDSTLGVTAWSSPNGATVDLTAVPSEHAKDDSAEFVVRLNGKDMMRIPCQWEDNAYTASADLNAADGYSYFVALSGKDGAYAEIPVSASETLTDLADSLESYCSLTLDETELSEGDLTILNGYAIVQAPRITANNENVACAQATLVLTLDGEEIGSVALTMAPGETDRSYDAGITDMSFTIPDTIGEGQELTLRLDAVLTDGQTLTAQGGSWYLDNGSMANAVG